MISTGLWRDADIERKADYLRFDLIKNVDMKEDKRNIYYGEPALKIPDPDPSDRFIAKFGEGPLKFFFSIAIARHYSMVLREIFTNSLLGGKEVELKKVTHRDFMMVFGVLLNLDKIFVNPQILLRKGVLEGALETAEFLDIPQFFTVVDMLMPRMMVVYEHAYAYYKSSSIVHNFEVPTPTDREHPIFAFARWAGEDANGEIREDSIGEHAMLKPSKLLPLLDRFKLSKSIDAILKCLLDSKEKIVFFETEMIKKFTSPGLTSESYMVFTRHLIDILTNEVDKKGYMTFSRN